MKQPKSITPEQAQNIISSVPFQTSVICQLAAETGLRISDILRMKKNYLMRKMVINEIKTKKLKHITLSDELYASMKLVSDESLRYVFESTQHRHEHTTRQTVHNHIKKVDKEASIHSFRKLYAQNLYKSTGDIKAVQKELNHKYLSTTCTYLDIDLDACILKLVGK